MTDIVERLRAEIDADVNEPLDRLLESAADEIERLRDMCINREEFIAQHNLWKEFSQYLSEPHSAVPSTECNPTGNMEGGA